MPFIEFYGTNNYKEQENSHGISFKNNASKAFERQQESQERAERAIREAEEQRAKEKYPKIFEH